MDPDDQRHATGIAAGGKVQIKPLPSVGGLGRPWLTVRLVAVCRDAGGSRSGWLSGWLRGRSRYGIGWHWRSDRRPGGCPLDRHLVERLAAA
jgi:hypothetical protein